jgi:hypothetical protein
MNADPKVMLVFIIIGLIHNEIKFQLEKRLHKEGSDELNESGKVIQSYQVSTSEEFQEHRRHNN